MALFGGTALIVGLVGYVLFLLQLGYYMSPWYYLMLLALVAACTDAIMSVWAASHWGRMARLACAVALASCSLLPTWRSATERKTRIDLVAAKLQESVAADDLIVVSPWSSGVSFHRYYHGPARWMTVPPMAPAKLHRYDRLKEILAAPHPIDPLLQEMAVTLRSGRRVWIVGDMNLLPLDQPVPDLPPAPNTPAGWHDVPYYLVWAAQIGRFVQLHATRHDRVPVPVRQTVNPYENVPLYRVEGWMPAGD